MSPTPSPHQDSSTAPIPPSRLQTPAPAAPAPGTPPQDISAAPPTSHSAAPTVGSTSPPARSHPDEHTSGPGNNAYMHCPAIPSTPLETTATPHERSPAPPPTTTTSVPEPHPK